MDHSQHMHHEMPHEMSMSPTATDDMGDMGDMGHGDDHSSMTMAMWVCIYFLR